jgi:hypothetical protein
VTAVPKGLKLSAGCYTYTTETLDRIKNSRKGQGSGTTRKKIVHVDNASSHTVELSMYFMDANRLTRSPNLPYSPDLPTRGVFNQNAGGDCGYSEDTSASKKRLSVKEARFQEWKNVVRANGVAMLSREEGSGCSGTIQYWDTGKE